MAQICDIARRTGIYVVSDEIYEDIIFEGGHVSAGASGRGQGFRGLRFLEDLRHDRMAAWLARLPEELAPIAAGLQEPVTSCASTVAQKAGEAALEGEQETTGNFRDASQRRRDIVVNMLRKYRAAALIPEGAFYALVDIHTTGRGSLEFARDLLVERNTAVVPGITFGPSCDRYVRIAFTIADDELREGLRGCAITSTRAAANHDHRRRLTIHDFRKR